ncbi:MAG: hypothetical protein AAFQ90_08740, partial [Pseudomonadota bacterium]
MTDAPSPTSFRSAALTALSALIFGFLGAAIWSVSGLADNRTHSFLMDNPEILPAMAEELQARENSRRLAQAMGGEIALSSRVGEGSRFTLSLPCRPAPGSIVAPSPSALSSA